MLRIATSSNYIDSESLVNDTFQWMSLLRDVDDPLSSLPCKKLRSPDVLGSVRVRCSGLRQRVFWLSSAWVQSHTDFVDQIPTGLTTFVGVGESQFSSSALLGM